MTYTVLARRYRSRTFDEVVGQAAVANTLKTAIETDRVGHAYLFCGTRGVGKTTMARLFAAAINVPDSISSPEETRDAIMRGEDLDVIEIDGASNRGVQEARDLIANAGLAPARCPYKVYIIDEVHMLTTESFNTLLKTMEEPPPHVKFILCTTEPNKVLSTIQSRCQRFDFKPIPSASIAGHLRDVLDREGVEAADEVVSRVAELGNGSMRDALSVLERLLAAGHLALDCETVDQVLGLPDQQRVASIVEAVLEGDPGLSLKHSASLLADGSSLEQVLGSLIDTLRIMLLMSTCGSDTDLVEITETSRSQLSALVDRMDPQGILHLLALCEHASRSARLSSSARAVFDATIVRMALADNLLDVQAVLAGQSPTGAAALPEKKTADKPLINDRKPSVRTSSVTPDVVKQSSEQSKDRRAEPRTEQPVAATSLNLEGLWERTRSLASSAGMKAKIDSFRPVAMSDGVLQLEVRTAGGGDFLRSTVGTLEEVVAEAAGMTLRLEVLPGNEPKPAPVRSSMEDSVQQDPAVRLASDLLEAVVVEVETPDRKNGA